MAFRGPLVETVPSIARAITCVRAITNGQVRKWLDQGYSCDSTDGRNHSAISEASCQGHAHIVEFLLGLGGDPNLLADTGRSPLFRAAFNGHEGAGCVCGLRMSSIP